MFVFYGHGGSDNHGCEAIVRSSIKILNQSVKLFSVNDQQDLLYGIDKICEVYADVDIPLIHGSRKWFLSSLQTKLTGKIDKQIEYRKTNLLKTINENDIYFSIGGDNYCYAGNEIYAAERNIIQRKGAKVILWGCSIEPELTECSEIARDLARYNFITVRESISYKALRKINSNILQVSDPAFILEKKECPLPIGWQEGNTVGINASPLIMQKGENRQIVYEAYRRLIEMILKTTECTIVFIPHVVWKENDDRKPLLQLYQEFKNSKRVILIENCNCMELKGYIARCRFFVGARTHATIAAYSSCVPTLVLGYSVKSRGIARDLFGTEENYVLSVQTMKEPDELKNHFKWIMKHENEIRNHLEEIMPEYISKAYLGKKALEKLI